MLATPVRPSQRDHSAMWDKSYIDKRRLSNETHQKGWRNMELLDKVQEMKTRPRNRSTPESIALGQRMVQALDKSGKSQSDLARALDVNRQTIQQLCAGFNDNPSFRRIVKIADTLGIEPRWLGTGEGPMLPGATKLSEAEQELMGLYRQLPKDRQSEVTGFTRGLVGAAQSSRSASASALQSFIEAMSGEDAQRLTGFLSLLQKARGE